MDLTTRYLGLTLPHPFMPGASPMVDDMDLVRRLEDAGAAAIVMHSLFEEQITREEVGTIRQMEIVSGSYPEALTYLSLIHISEPTRLGMISYAVFCLKKKNK